MFLFQIWITFSPIADTTVPYYQITPFQLNILVLVFAIASVPFGFIASWVLDTLGLRFSVSFVTTFIVKLCCILILIRSNVNCFSEFSEFTFNVK